MAAFGREAFRQGGLWQGAFGKEDITGKEDIKQACAGGLVRRFLGKRLPLVGAVHSPFAVADGLSLRLRRELAANLAR